MHDAELLAACLSVRCAALCEDAETGRIAGGGFGLSGSLCGLFASL